MNKVWPYVLPIIMVVAFWGIYIWGMANPKVGEAIMAITIAGVVVCIAYIGKKIIWTIITKSSSNSQ